MLTHFSICRSSLPRHVICPYQPHLGMCTKALCSSRPGCRQSGVRLIHFFFTNFNISSVFGIKDTLLSCNSLCSPQPQPGMYTPQPHLNLVFHNGSHITATWQSHHIIMAVTSQHMYGTATTRHMYSTASPRHMYGTATTQSRPSQYLRHCLATSSPGHALTHCSIELHIAPRPRGIARR